MIADGVAAPDPVAASTDAREVEWQLQATDLAAVQSWLQEHARVQEMVLEPCAPLHILDRYLDTDDWRMHRAGFALRLRDESGRCAATLKSLHSAQQQVADRRELTEPLSDTDPGQLQLLQGPVGSRVGAVIGSRPLRTLFEIRTSRHRFAVRAEGESTPLGEVALDETLVVPPHGRPHTSLKRVEIEALTEMHEPLQRLVELLRTQCGLERAPESKFALGLRAAGLTPTPAVALEAANPTVSMSMESLASACLRRYVNAWHRHEPAARLGDDAEELHDLRVAGRRLAAALSLFRAHVRPSLDAIRPRLKSLLAILGEARDFDIALNELDAFSLELPKAERAGVKQLRTYLCEQRQQARARMLSTLDSEEVQSAFATLVDALRTPSSDAPGTDIDAAGRNTNGPAIEKLPTLIRARHRKLRRRAEKLTAHSAPEQYHAVRRQVKKLRYGIESVAGLYGKPAQEHVRLLRRLQERLGIQHDADVAQARLRALAAATPGDIAPDTLFLMGRLAERQAAAAQRARKRFLKAYRKVSGRGWKVLKSRMDATTG